MRSFILAALAVTGCQAFYDKSSNVIELDDNNFKKHVLQSEHVHVVEFFAPWCGHCKSLVPEYKKAATNLKGLVKFGAVDCDNDKNKGLCSQYGIQGFPTIKVFYTKQGKDGADTFTKIPVDYKGERRAGAIGDFAVDRMTSHVVQLTHGKSNKGATGYEDFFAQGNSSMPKAILFTDKEKTAGLYKALSLDFKGRMRLAEARGSTIAEKFAISKFPTILVIPPGKDAVAYDGSLKHEHLHKFLAQHALEATWTTTRHSRWRISLPLMLLSCTARHSKSSRITASRRVAFASWPF